MSHVCISRVIHMKVSFHTYEGAMLHTATHRNTPQHTATHRNTLQHTATHCNRSSDAASEVAKNAAQFARVRQGVTQLLSKVPIVSCITTPSASGEVGGGGLYMAIDVTALGLSAEEIASVVLEEAEVCVVGVSHGEQQLVRLCLSLAHDEAVLKGAVRKVGKCLAGLALDMA